MRSEGLKGFVLGYAMFAVTGLVWCAIGIGTGSSRWVMQPHGGIVFALIVQFLAAAVFAADARPGFQGLGGLVGGVALAIAAIRYLVGPGDAWSSMIGIDLMLLLPAVGAGFGIGVLLGRTMHLDWNHGESHSHHPA